MGRRNQAAKVLGGSEEKLVIKKLQDTTEVQKLKVENEVKKQQEILTQNNLLVDKLNSKQSDLSTLEQKFSQKVEDYKVLKLDYSKLQKDFSDLDELYQNKKLVKENELKDFYTELINKRDLILGKIKELEIKFENLTDNHQQVQDKTNNLYSVNLSLKLENEDLIAKNHLLNLSLENLKINYDNLDKEFDLKNSILTKLNQSAGEIDAKNKEAINNYNQVQVGIAKVNDEFNLAKEKSITKRKELLDESERLVAIRKLGFNVKQEEHRLKNKAKQLGLVIQ